MFELANKRKIWKNLQVEDWKDNKVLIQTIFLGSWLNTNKVKLDDKNMQELQDKQHIELSTRVDNWTYKGSGWTHQKLNNSMRGLIET